MLTIKKNCKIYIEPGVLGGIGFVSKRIGENNEIYRIEDGKKWRIYPK